mmetsp:Transcript_97618/g.276160  ORF Transcript_97618/g.276160 Transcript_97618/m.276160 type:complete len:237 (-) Transcript_97618:399-1109(-)
MDDHDPQEPIGGHRQGRGPTLFRSPPGNEADQSFHVPRMLVDEITPLLDHCGIKVGPLRLGRRPQTFPKLGAIPKRGRHVDAHCRAPPIHIGKLEVDAIPLGPEHFCAMRRELAFKDRRECIKDVWKPLAEVSVRQLTDEEHDLRNVTRRQDARAGGTAEDNLPCRQERILLDELAHRLKPPHQVLVTRLLRKTGVDVAVNRIGEHYLLQMLTRDLCSQAPQAPGGLSHTLGRRWH